MEICGSVFLANPASGRLADARSLGTWTHVSFRLLCIAATWRLRSLASFGRKQCNGDSR
jgi:hypothetical protein